MLPEAANLGHTNRSEAGTYKFVLLIGGILERLD